VGSWRYIATRLNGDGTETFLSYDVPISGAQVTDVLSGAGGITGTITPEVAVLKDENGNPIFLPWSTAIYAEADGQIRGGGILSGFEEHGPDLSLDAVSFTGYANGMPYTGRDSFTNSDPLDLVRHMWGHMQLAARGDIGMNLDGTTSKVRIGKPDTPEYAAAFAADEEAQTVKDQAEADYDAAKEQADLDKVFAFEAVGATLTAKSKVIKQPTAPGGGNASSENLWVDEDTNVLHTYNGSEWVAYPDQSVMGLVNTAVASKAAQDAAAVVRTAARKAASEASSALSDVSEGKAEPYVLSYEKTHDIGKEIEDLSVETPFDYREVHRWDGDTIRHELKFGYPDIRARRHDLRFVVGENVAVAPQLDYDGDAYASEVLVLGAGTGAKMVRGDATRTTTRLRRVAVVEDKTVTTTDRAKAIAAAEVAQRSGDVDIQDLLVWDHPHAPLGSYTVGDEILITTRQGWTNQLSLWCRVLAVTITPESGTTALKVARVEKA
jgi:hypothetical protein